MAETKRPLLELDTLVEPDTIRIDGKDYTVVNLQALPILEEVRLRKKILANSREQDRLLKPAEGEPSEEDAAQAGKLFDENVRLILDVPDDVFAKLNTEHKAKILMAFFKRPPEQTPQAPAEPGAETPESTGESKSPDSSGSMVAATP